VGLIVSAHGMMHLSFTCPVIVVVVSPLISYIDTCTHFVAAMARNASWQCVPFLWHAASRESGVKTCLRPVRALYTHFYAQFTQCANKMTAIDTQWNDLFTDTSRYVCAPPRIAPTTSRMREFVVAFFDTCSTLYTHCVSRKTTQL